MDRSTSAAAGASGTPPAPGSPIPTVAIVLAGGAGRRFTGPGHKLDAMIGGRSMAAIAVGAAVEAGIGPVVVVTGDHDLGTLPAELAAAVEFVHNPKWATGQLTSLHCGLEAAARHGADAAVIGLADQPFVPPEAWRAVAASPAPIGVATYDGRRGNPVRLHSSVWPLLPSPSPSPNPSPNADAGRLDDIPDGSGYQDRGARSLIELRPDLVEAVPCPGSAADIDTLEDLERWQSNS